MRALLTTLAGLLCLASPVLSAEAKPAPARTGFEGARDLEIQIRARRALCQDEELGPFNLGVSVQDGVAVVWGPVTSPELRSKALRKVENVRGVFKVRGEMYLSSTAGQLTEPALQALPNVPEQRSSALPNRQTGMLPPWPGKLATNKIDDLFTTPKPIKLMIPVAVFEEDAGLAAAVERIRVRDERFRSVRYEMKNGAIYLRGAKAENVMAFARAISSVPGIERVVLQSESNTR